MWNDVITNIKDSLLNNNINFMSRFVSFNFDEEFIIYIFTVIFFQRKIYLFPLNYGMPTINQLIKQGRSKKKSKSKAPVLQF